MKLTPTDAELFFRLFFGLLAYANRLLKLKENQQTAEEIRELGSQGVIKIRNALYKHPKVLEQYIAENPDQLSPEELNVIAGWRHRITGDFYVMHYLKKYAVFMPTEKPYHLYGVLGLCDSLTELLQQEPPPFGSTRRYHLSKGKLCVMGWSKDTTFSSVPASGATSISSTHSSNSAKGLSSSWSMSRQLQS